MNHSMNKDCQKLSKLKKLIKKDGLVVGSKQKIIAPGGLESFWLFDIKTILLQPKSLEIITDLFWELFEKEYPFQVAGQETASIPMISAIILHGQKIGKPVSGFIIRKSRKPLGLQKIIEGSVTSEKIILVDDLINNGSAVEFMLKVIGDLNKKVSFIFTLLNYRGKENVEKLDNKGIKLISLYTPADFGLTLEKRDPLPEEGFFQKWSLAAENPSYHHRAPKSSPCLDEKNVYFGTDSGIFYALDQKSGSINWEFQATCPVLGKGIDSSPVILENKIFFGSSNGNVYALDRKSGKILWRYFDADYVSSSPSIAPRLGLLFIGLEFGLFRHQGAIVALDIESGKCVWENRMEKPIHSSPAYCQKNNLLAIGCDNGFVYALDAKNGKLKWKFKSNGPVRGSFAFNSAKNQIIFGSFDGKFYALDLDTGEKKGEYETGGEIYSTPKIYGKKVIFTSTDKNAYCLDLETGKIDWKFRTRGRILSSPSIIENNVFFGSNDGRMYEVDLESGRLVSYFQTTERITNKIAYSQDTKHFFLSTYANRIYCLERKKQVET